MRTRRKALRLYETGKVYLVEGGVQGKEFAVAVGLAMLFVVPVDLLIGGAVEEVREEGIGEGVLQVEDAAGPASTRGVVYRHGPPLQVILQETRHTQNGGRLTIFFSHPSEVEIGPLHD